MTKLSFLTLWGGLLLSYALWSSEGEMPQDALSAPPAPRYHYGHQDREHPLSESLTHIGAIYALSWLTYYATQPVTFREQGSFKKYGDNLGKIVFDQDEPIWNWVVHPFSGSQLYLYYRANGYRPIEAIKMNFISSTLFEFLVEIYTEPASFQDLYQTPILGSLLGLGLEHLSLALLNTGNPVWKVLGHILNPYTLFWFYPGPVRVSPIAQGLPWHPISTPRRYGLQWSLEF